MKNVKSVAIVVMLLVLTFTACASSEDGSSTVVIDSPVVGTWNFEFIKSEDGETWTLENYAIENSIDVNQLYVIYTFKDNGSFTVDYMDNQSAGAYKIDGNKITMIVSGGEESVEFEFEYDESQDTISSVDESGYINILTRA